MGTTPRTIIDKTVSRRKSLAVVLLTLLVAFFFFCSSVSGEFPRHGGILNLSAWLDGHGIRDDVVYSVVQMDVGQNVLLAGYTKSSGAGGSDVWLVKTREAYSPLGSVIDGVNWSRTYGGAQDDAAKCIIQADGGFYVMAGYTNSYGTGGSDMYLVKVDSDGNLLWNTTYGGPENEAANSIVQTSDGGFILAGHTTSDASARSTWLVKTSSSGNMQWNATYPGQEANVIIQTNDGGYAVATRHFNAFGLIKLDSAGQVQWNRTYHGSGYDANAESVIQTSDGGYALAGWTKTSEAGIDSPWLVKTNASGTVQWERNYGGTLGVYAVVQTSDGGYAMTGDRACLIMIDSSGNVWWNHNYDGLSEDNLHFTRIYSIIQPFPDHFVMAGTQQSYGQNPTGLDGRMWRITQIPFRNATLPTASPSATPTPTPSPTQTPSPTSTPTLDPIATPSTSPSPSQSPTTSPSPSQLPTSPAPTQKPGESAKSQDTLSTSVLIVAAATALIAFAIYAIAVVLRKR